MYNNEIIFIYQIISENVKKIKSIYNLKTNQDRRFLFSLQIFINKKLSNYYEKFLG